MNEKVLVIMISIITDSPTIYNKTNKKRKKERKKS